MAKTPPIAETDDAPRDLEPFRTDDRRKIERILHDLAERQEPVTLYYGKGQNSMVIPLVHADAEQGEVYLGLGADEDAERHPLATKQVLCVAHHSRGPVQFTADAIAAGEWEGSPALIFPFPQSLIQVQRREFYRVRIPDSEPLFCRIDLGTRQVEAGVADISLGGIGLIEPEAAQEFEFQEGAILRRCRIEIPNEGLVETAIEISSCFAVTAQDGSIQRRAGCRFLDLNPRMSASIQRYIHRIELERHWTRGEG